MLQVSEQTSLRSGNDHSATTNKLAPQPTPAVRWVIQDLSQTDTDIAGKPVPVSITDKFGDRFCERAHSLPNLADDNWAKLENGLEDDDNGKMKSTAAETATQPVTVATDVSTVRSLMTSSLSPSSYVRTASVSSSSSKMRRAASFAEHPVIAAVSSFCFGYKAASNA